MAERCDRHCDRGSAGSRCEICLAVEPCRPFGTDGWDAIRVVVPPEFSVPTEGFEQPGTTRGSTASPLPYPVANLDAASNGGVPATGPGASATEDGGATSAAAGVNVDRGQGTAVAEPVAPASLAGGIGLVPTIGGQGPLFDAPAARSEGAAANPSELMTAPLAIATNLTDGTGQTSITDVPEAAPPGVTGVTAQLSQQLMQSLAIGAHDVVLQLHPPELGEVSVRLLVSGRDVSAWFTAPQALVQQAIGQGMAQLHSDLADAGYSLNGAWVGGEAWTPQQRAERPAPTGHSRRAAGGDPVEEPAATRPAAARHAVSVYV
jgi:hypothetical protein